MFDFAREIELPILEFLDASFFQVSSNSNFLTYAVYLSRIEDYRKVNQRIANLQVTAVLIGAGLGGIPSLLDRYIDVPYPLIVVNGALLASTLVNLISLKFL